MRYTYRYRSFFWPAILILGGVVALLVNTGQIPVDRLYQLVNLWPVVLVVIGLELIIRRTVHGLTGDVAAALIVLIAVVGAAAYVTVGPNPSATHTLDAATPAGDLTEATLEIDAGASTVTLSGSTGVGADLYRAHLEYTGPTPTVNHDSSRGTVRINQRSNNFGILQPLHFKANVQLNPGVAWAIRLNSGATTTTINVAHVHVTSVTLNSGAGRDDRAPPPRAIRRARRRARAPPPAPGSTQPRAPRPRGSRPDRPAGGRARRLPCAGAVRAQRALRRLAPRISSRPHWRPPTRASPPAGGRPPPGWLRSPGTARRPVPRPWPRRDARAPRSRRKATSRRCERGSWTAAPASRGAQRPAPVRRVAPPTIRGSSAPARAPRPCRCRTGSR